MTFSISARCARTGRFGLAVCSSSPAVAARCIFARAGIGAVATQNITDPALGPRILDLMALGASSDEALSIVRQSTSSIEYRQLCAVDAQGRTAVFSGSQTLGRFAQAKSEDVVCAGNLLATSEIPAIMLSAFCSHTECDLVDRLLLAMDAAMMAGGEAGPVHSAGLLIVDKTSWPVADLRVDWHAQGEPLRALGELWVLYSPQMDDYVIRATDPACAPRFAVPGDS